MYRSKYSLTPINDTAEGIADWWSGIKEKLGSPAVLSIGFYIIVLTFVAGVILVLVNAKYSIFPSASASTWIPPGWLSTDYFPSGYPYVNNMKITAEDAPRGFPTAFGYSIQTDVILFNTRAKPALGQSSRHIFHRGSAELDATTVRNQLLDTQLGYHTNDGLGQTALMPAIMNPGVFCDPKLNDILIYMDTNQGSGEDSRESFRLSNIPLDKPFRLGMVVFQSRIEVYINCQLFKTYVLKGTPIAITDQTWWVLSGKTAASAGIQNFRLWTHPLTVGDFRGDSVIPWSSIGLGKLCPNPPVFPVTVRAACDMASIEMPQDEDTAAGPAVGYGNTICGVVPRP